MRFRNQIKMAKKDVELMKLVQAIEESIQSSVQSISLMIWKLLKQKEKSLPLTNVGRKKTPLQCSI
jgi:hypothetical protein